MVATNPAQLVVAEIPAVMLTLSLVEPVPPGQYIVKVHTPAATVCAGRPVHPQVVVIPPDADWIWQAVPRIPTEESIEVAVHPGAAPVPWRYRGLPAARTVGAFVDAIASALMTSASTPIATQPTQRGRRAIRLSGTPTGPAEGSTRPTLPPVPPARKRRSR